MRIRTIKPEFWISESLGRIPRDARLTFIGLWSVADDGGRFRADSRYLAGQLYPYDDDALGTIEAAVNQLQVEGCIRVYTVKGSTYGEITGWSSHQKIDKPSKSKLPAPPSDDTREHSRGLGEPSRTFGEDSANPREPSWEDQGSGIRDQGKDQGSGRARPASGKKRSRADQEQTPESPTNAENGPSDEEQASEQGSLPGMPPKPPRARSFAQELHALFISDRELKLEADLRMIPCPPDDPPNWALANVQVAAWRKYAEEKLEFRESDEQETFCRSMIDEYLDGESCSWAAGCMKKDRDGNKTETPQPYPWNVLMSPKQWLKVADACRAKLDGEAHAA